MVVEGNINTIMVGSIQSITKIQLVKETTGGITITRENVNRAADMKASAIEIETAVKITEGDIIREREKLVHNSADHRNR